MLFIKHTLKLEVEKDVIKVNMLRISSIFFLHLNSSYPPHPCAHPTLETNVLQGLFIQVGVALVCSTTNTKLSSDPYTRLLTYFRPPLKQWPLWEGSRVRGLSSPNPLRVKRLHRWQEIFCFPTVVLVPLLLARANSLSSFPIRL